MKLSTIITVIINHVYISSIFKYASSLKFKDYIQLKNTTNDNEFEVSLFSRCFSKDRERIVIIGNYSIFRPNSYHRSTVSKDIVVLEIKKNESLKDYNTKVKYYTLHNSSMFNSLPAHNFVVAEFKFHHFKLAVIKLQRSIWWNAGGFFLIKNTLIFDGCKNAPVILDFMWRLNVLSTVYVCRDENYKLTFYTYNPYNGRAPKYWSRVGKYSKNGERPITLLKNSRDYPDFMPACDVLNFDKTMSLERYPVKLCRSAKHNNTKLAVSIYEQFSHDIWDHLKASKQIFEVPDDSIGTITEGVANGTISDTLEGKYDMLMIDDYQREAWRNTLNTFIVSGMCYVTEKRIKPIIHRLIGSLSMGLWLSLLAFILSTATAFTLMLKNSFTENVINIIRAVVGTSMLNEPRRWYRKVVFIWLIFTFMIVNYYLQSQMNAILTELERYFDHIESYESLSGYKYEIYSSEYFRQYFYNWDFGKRIQSVDSVSHCLKLMCDNRVVCIDDCVEMKFKVRESLKYHISRDVGFNRYNVLLFRDDFPLQTRVATLYRRLFQSGVVSAYQVQQSWYFLKERIAQTYKGMPLNKFEFPFYFLLYAQAFALLVFTAELLVFRITREFNIFGYLQKRLHRVYR
ncbi:hypothetical protein TSAR_011837 [Trichomalopsis sarcophagae]|uniref:Ionotropic glutamate receptor C-terminal domain-containing protein n=1 Tax=Trichomalopsis sarcophagae TaxID=543379 RepID=A0A232ET51_9HYME|nr:hypothetical protein TSAR_011837 [Trichomalopsis sarcophagae]